MDKIEFLNILRDLLEQEMPSYKVEEHIRYYDDYISSAGDALNQQKEIENIGDPRLIAQTIIESYKMSDEYKYTGQGKNASYYNNETYETYQRNEQNDFNQSGKDVWSSIRRGVVIAAVLLVLFIILGFVAKVFFTVGIPILLCYVLIRLLMAIFQR